MHPQDTALPLVKRYDSLDVFLTFSYVQSCIQAIPVLSINHDILCHVHQFKSCHDQCLHLKKKRMQIRIHSRERPYMFNNHIGPSTTVVNKTSPPENNECVLR